MVCSVSAAMRRLPGHSRLRNARGRIYDVDDCRCHVPIVWSVVRPQEDAIWQRPDVAEQLQEDRASHRHHRAVERVLRWIRRCVDGAVCRLQTQERPEGRGLH